MANLGYIQVTRRCNQRCKFCSNPPVDAERSLEQAKALANNLKAQGYHGVILTGGEPTLEETLPELVAHCRSLGLPPRIISNGSQLADPRLLDDLLEAGLEHYHLSLHSHDAKVHDDLTRRPGSHDDLLAALELLSRHHVQLRVNINTVITTANGAGLHELAAMIIERYPKVRHFVFNGLDPEANRLLEHPELVPRLFEFEISLAAAARLIEGSGRTLRIERVPLCYMPGFEHCSTETRKIVKAEERTTHFLDRRGAVRQGPEAFVHRHHEPCAKCSLRRICAGLHTVVEAHDPQELAPQFIDAEPIRSRIHRQVNPYEAQT